MHKFVLILSGKRISLVFTLCSAPVGFWNVNLASIEQTSLRVDAGLRSLQLGLLTLSRISTDLISHPI